MTMQEQRNLRRLAALHRVQTSYIDMHGRRRAASPETLLAVLQTLGVPVSGMAGVEDATRARRQQILDEWVAPVIVAWDGQADAIQIRIPASILPTHAIGSRLQYTLHLEDGDIWSGNMAIDQARTLRYVNCAGEISAVKAILPPRPIPFGCHKLTVLIGSRAFSTTVIAAPRQVYPHPTLSRQERGRGEEEPALQVRGRSQQDCFPSGQGLPGRSVVGKERLLAMTGEPLLSRNERQWGLFAPIYALRSDRNWGVGDFTDAGALAAWTAEQGGSLLGTLPFLASYLDQPCDPSPYTPVSRFFWNELFVDMTRLPELSWCSEAQELIGSEAYRAECSALRSERLVDYRRAMRLKRDVMSVLSRHLRETGGRRYESLRTYVNRNGELAEYARFRAVTRRRGEVWTQWPDGLREGRIEEGDFDQDEEFYHLYAQFVAGEQVDALSKRCRLENVDLYLDYPLGTHPEGFDTWRSRDRFAMEATVGAPPDPVFTTGQDWGFHPLHPEHERRGGYEYFRASIRHQMEHAGMLRLDHVMGLHRLYWIPAGFDKSEGVYVHYRSDELYAILALESHRAKTVLVGENLGIVPAYVNHSMRLHGLVGMNIAYWELACDPEGALGRMAAHPNAVVSLNTHDMFPFAAFWRGLDADRRAELGMITEEQADLERWLRGELRARMTGYLRAHGTQMADEYDTEGALRGILALLSASQARWMLVNLEDLWLETSPQNIPDTVDEHPNWRQKAKLTIEELMRDKEIREILRMAGVQRTEPGKAAAT